MIEINIPEYSKRKLHENETIKIIENKFYVYENGWLVAITKELNW